MGKEEGNLGLLQIQGPEFSSGLFLLKEMPE